MQILIPGSLNNGRARTASGRRAQAGQEFEPQSTLIAGGSAAPTIHPQIKPAHECRARQLRMRVLSDRQELRRTEKRRHVCTPGARFVSLAAEETARLPPAWRPLESTDVHDHRRRSRRARQLQRPAWVDRMDRALRRRAHRPRVRDAGPAALARGARHRRQPRSQNVGPPGCGPATSPRSSASPRPPSPTTSDDYARRARRPTSAAGRSSRPSADTEYASANSATCASGTSGLHASSGAHFLISDAKTEAGLREVQVSPDLLDEIVARIDRLQRSGLPTTPAAHLFPNMRGGRMKRQRANEIVREAAELASPAWPRAAWRRCRTPRPTHCAGHASRSRSSRTDSTCSG
jgi:hypothetical protein